MKSEAVLDLGPVGVGVIVTALRFALDADVFTDPDGAPDTFQIAAAADVLRLLDGGE